MIIISDDLIYYMVKSGDWYSPLMNVIEIKIGIGDVITLAMIYILYKWVDAFSKPRRIIRKCRCDKNG